MGTGYLEVLLGLLMLTKFSAAGTYCDLYASDCFTGASCPTGYDFVATTGIAGCEICCRAKVAVNECADGSHNCDTNAVCIDTATSFECRCNAGFDGNGVTCTDIPECNSNPCDPNASCTELPGSFTCTCNTGYAGNGFSCVEDPDECLQGKDNCHDTLGICTNIQGGWTCACISGYTGDGVTCTDINECLNANLNNCHADATCSNTLGSYTCACKQGFAGDGVSCVPDQDECQLNLDNCIDASLGGVCTNTLGSWSCSCTAGYTGNGVDYCSNVDECKDSPCGNGICADTVGSFTCSCYAGYELNSANNCVDINECLQPNICGEHATCTNSVGSYTCACDLNYEYNQGKCTLKQCGLPGTMSRLLFGTNAPDCKWGWSVSVRVNVSGYAPTFANTMHVCSGVIVDMDWVLTSAACVSFLPSTATYLVSSGTISINPGSENNQNMQQRVVVEQRKHPGFVHGNIAVLTDPSLGVDANYAFQANQFVLLKMESSFEFNTCTQAICLPEVSTAGCSTDTECFIAGWGANQGVLDGSISYPNFPTLQEDKVTLLSTAACEVIRKFQNRKEPTPAAETCAMDQMYDMSNGVLPSKSCFGDAGSGFYCRGSDGFYRLKGINLFEPVDSCTKPDLPYMVGNVEEVVNWIKSEIAI